MYIYHDFVVNKIAFHWNRLERCHVHNSIMTCLLPSAGLNYLFPIENESEKNAEESGNPPRGD